VRARFETNEGCRGAGIALKTLQMVSNQEKGA
jgi:hypothetical protein